MLFLVGNVGESIGYVFCVFPLVEFCLRPDFRVYTVENLLTEKSAYESSLIKKIAYTLLCHNGIEHSIYICSLY